MAETVRLQLGALDALVVNALTTQGLSERHARATAKVIVAGQWRANSRVGSPTVWAWRYHPRPEQKHYLPPSLIGGRLPSQRRFAARARSLADGVDVPAALHSEVVRLCKVPSRRTEVT